MILSREVTQRTRQRNTATSTANNPQCFFICKNQSHSTQQLACERKAPWPYGAEHQYNTSITTKEATDIKRTFDSPEQLEQLFDDYMRYCVDNHLMSNVAGFCTYLRKAKDIKVHRQNLYNYSKYPEYQDTLKSIDDTLEDATLNSKEQRDLIKLAYLNNKFGYRSEQQPVKVDVDISVDKLEARIQQLLQLREPEHLEPQQIQGLQDK